MMYVVPVCWFIELLIDWASLIGNCGRSTMVIVTLVILSFCSDH